MEAAPTGSLADTADSAIVDAASMLTALAALATLSEQNVGLQRQVSRLRSEIEASEARGRDLTDAKFVTYRTLIDSQADKVKLALEATEKAIDKAERATEKAIDKAEAANDKRFESVNEFRAQLTDLIARFATLERVDLLYNQTRQRMDEINNHLDGRISDMGDRLGDMGNRITKIEEYARGAQGNKSGIYAAIGAAVGILTIVVIVISVFGR